ncbi:MAG: 4Fe-4S dicluster domain-containing protein [Verrucomicrobiae bacterium]|nr:4Fe-4S dicluster domain-containing protein [Verrucomicrobiae bacterium]
MSDQTFATPFLPEDKALACVHCGLCLGACPTYLETGNENDSPRGRIYLMRAVAEGRVSAEAAREHVDLCLGCRACETACPSGVQYGALLEVTRQHLEREVSRSFIPAAIRRVLIDRVFPFRERMDLALAPARLIKRLGLEKWLPGFARDPLKLLPMDMKRAELPEESPARGRFRGRVGFVSGCVMDVMFGETHRNSVMLLNAAGFDVVTPASQGCCGALHAHSGNLEEARILARKNIVAFDEADVDRIVINAAGCGSTLKEYGHLLACDAEWAESGRKFSARVRDLSEFLVEEGFDKQLQPRAGEGSVTFHDACHLAHPQKITRQPRDLVKAVAGDRFVEMPESDVCCGSAGSYNLTEPEMAARLQQRKVGNIRASGALTVVTTNPGCLLQIAAGLRDSTGLDVEALHIADYLARALRG